jgi:hypothetical protein
MNIEELHRRIKQTKSIKDNWKRLSELRMLLKK